MRQICAPSSPSINVDMVEYYTAIARPSFDRDRNSALAFIVPPRP